MQHPMRLGAFKPLLRLLGATPARSYVEVGPSELTFRFGYYEETLARSQIAWAARSRWPLWGGIGWRLAPVGRLGLIGSLEGIVELQLCFPLPTRLLFIPFEATRVFVSLQDPEAFLAELGAPARPAA